jgi:hypothetical protein
MSLSLAESDPQVAAAIDNEVRRQHEGLELIHLAATRMTFQGAVENEILITTLSC